MQAAEILPLPEPAHPVSLSLAATMRIVEIVQAVLGLSLLPALFGFYVASSWPWVFGFAGYLALALAILFLLGRLPTDQKGGADGRNGQN
jgi:hypothetical protein